MGEPTFTKFIFNLFGKVSFGASVTILGDQDNAHVPERTLGPHAEILQDEPDPHFIIRIGEFESAYTEAANEIAGEHATRLGTRIARGSTEL